MGVNTTIIPVMNADFDAVVYSKPTVCVAKPMKRRRPRIDPLRSDDVLIVRIRGEKTVAKMIEAVKKRMVV
jgi:hypothetical protein